jgi:putative FmdB family regulatory protein
VPTYEYECKSCKAVYELRQGFDAATTHKCEECGKGTAKRVLRVPSVVFKGSGWYLTDSRNSKTAVSEGGASASDAESSPGGDSKTESKPAAKAEAKTESKKSESKSSSTTESAAAG